MSRYSNESSRQEDNATQYSRSRYASQGHAPAREPHNARQNTRYATNDSYNARQSYANARSANRAGQGQYRQTPRMQNDFNVNGSGYGRASYAARRQQAQSVKRKRTALIACGVVAAFAVIVGVGFGVTKLLSPEQPSGQTQQNTDAASTSIATETAVQTPAADDPGDIVMGLNGSAQTYVLKGESYVEGGAHAASATAGVLTQSIQASGNVDTSTVGDYEVTYKVSDSAGHTASVTRTVHVVESMETMKTGVPVCMFHYVYTASDMPDEVDANYILDTDLEAEMSYLKQNNFYFPSFAEVAAFVKGTHSLPANSVMLTFDDGEEGCLKYGGALAQKYEIPIVSFMICDSAESTVSRVISYANPYLEFESHSSTMHQAGGTVGHGGRISAMTKDEIKADLAETAQLIGSNWAFAYPFGDTTAEGQAAVSENGIICAFTTTNDWCYIGDDTTALNRVRINGTYSLDSFIALVTES